MTKPIELPLGGVSKLSVERALAELRAGRPIVVRRPEGDVLTCAAENLDDATLAALNASGASLRLVLTPARLRRLGRDADSPASALLAGATLAKIEEVVSAKTATLTWPVVEATEAERSGLEAVRLSLLLPCAVVARVDEAKALDVSALCHVNAADIATYQTDAAHSLRIASRAFVPLEGVETCEFVVFRGGDGLRDQIAVVIGAPEAAQPVLVRIHSACLTGDLFGSLKCDCGDQLRGAVQRMADEGGGVLLYLDQEGRGNGIANKIRAYRLQHEGHDTYDADEILGFENDHRRFDMAAEMIRQLGFSSVRLMTNNPQKIKALQDGGLNVAATHRVIARANGHNAGYIAAKRDRAGHLFDKDSSTVLRSD
ncbi:MAG: GTP cyclohydrolase II RibA [Hyphomicrobiales bacterium]|nr:GTP cyclohydrolase II RibA [Hyphomicrobiales bacterium]